MDMPLSARCLYFTLGMLADDDGFVGNPKSITRQCGASEEDMNTLITKKFVIRFESGVLAIKHWRMNNQIRKDRHHGTTYLEELSIIGIDNKGAYTTNPEKMVLSLSNGNQVSTKRQPSVNQTGDKLATEVRLGKDSTGKDSIDKDSNKPTKHIYGEYGHVRLTDDERNKLMDEYGEAETSEAIKYLDEYIEMKGYKAKSHYLCIKKWVFEAVNRNKPKQIDWNKV